MSRRTCSAFVKIDGKLHECGHWAVKKVEHAGCPHCGGGDCGDYPETDYFCAEHAQQWPASRLVDLSPEES